MTRKFLGQSPGSCSLSNLTTNDVQLAVFLIFNSGNGNNISQLFEEPSVTNADCP